MLFGRKKESKESEQLAREKVILYKKVFGGGDGREVLFDILNQNFVLNTHRGDAYSEGRRAAALDILSQCKISLAEFDKLLSGEGYDVAQ